VTTTVFLVRHATHDRLNRILCGRMPGVTLGAEGRAQAAALPARLRREPIVAVYASPLERACETAQPLADGLRLDVQVLDALNEIDVGAWSGRTFDDLRDDPLWTRWNTARNVTRPPGGEMMLEAQVRIVGAIEHLRAAHPEQSVALVSHGDVIKAALAYYLGLALDAILRFDISPASVSTLVVGDWGAKILSMNEGAVA